MTYTLKYSEIIKDLGITNMSGVLNKGLWALMFSHLLCAHAYMHTTLDFSHKVVNAKHKIKLVLLNYWIYHGHCSMSMM